jgi:ribosome-binding factor A
VSRRTERLNRAIQQEVSSLLEKQIQDPRLSSLISITGVSITEDLRHVRVYVSVLGDEETRAQALAGFHAASGFIRREVSTNLRMRHAPEFSFIYDDSIERGSAVLDMLEKLNSET